MWTSCEAVGGGDEAGRVKAEGEQVLRRRGCEGRGRDESMRSEQASEWVWVGQSWRDEAGGRWRLGGRDKVPIKTSRAIPTHGGAGRADFAKVSLSQRGAGEVHPLGAGGAL